MKTLFSAKKIFEIDGIYNIQNDRIWVVNREQADIRVGIRQIRRFPQKVMVWLRTCSKGLSPLMIVENERVAHSIYINEVLLVALKYENNT